MNMLSKMLGAVFLVWTVFFATVVGATPKNSIVLKASDAPRAQYYDYFPETLCTVEYITYPSRNVNLYKVTRVASADEVPCVIPFRDIASNATLSDYLYPEDVYRLKIYQTRFDDDNGVPYSVEAQNVAIRVHYTTLDGVEKIYETVVDQTRQFDSPDGSYLFTIGDFANIVGIDVVADSTPGVTTNVFGFHLRNDIDHDDITNPDALESDEASSPMVTRTFETKWLFEETDMVFDGAWEMKAYNGEGYAVGYAAEGAVGDAYLDLAYHVDPELSQTLTLNYFAHRSDWRSALVEVTVEHANGVSVIEPFSQQTTEGVFVPEQYILGTFQGVQSVRISNLTADDQRVVIDSLEVVQEETLQCLSPE